MQSWNRVFENGFDAIKLRLKNSFDRMGPMDIADVAYDAFLINGARDSHLGFSKKDDVIKLRLINASSSSYMWFEFAGGQMTVIAADGVDVAPFKAQKILLATAETYDVLITIPDDKKYELRATSQDVSGFASTWIGDGEKVFAKGEEKINLFLTNHDHHASHKTSHQDLHHESQSHHQHNGRHNNQNEGVILQDYTHLQSTYETSFDDQCPRRTIDLHLTGTMERYVWTFNDKPMYASDHIVVKKGEVLHFRLINETMMHHPIHIHGHFFRVLNGHEKFSPLKHTVNVAPFQTIEIEMLADQDKDWIFHCHNLYHMVLGMGGLIHYQGAVADPDLNHSHANHLKDHGDFWISKTQISAASNESSASYNLMRGDQIIFAESRFDYHKDHEIEAGYSHYLSQFFNLYGGAKRERDENDFESRGFFGFGYVLPFLIQSDVRIDHRGDFRFQLSSEIELLERVHFDWLWNNQDGFQGSLNYKVNNLLYLSANYSSRSKLGAGLLWRF